MEKAISVNLGGMVFYTDLSAYDMLQAYLGSIEKEFINESEKEEIMADIESRIAELFLERLNYQKQVVTIEDIKAVMEILGDPKDFAPEEEENTSHEKQKKEKQASKRLYRDTEKRILGGVCAGLGAYFKMDPLVFRILFALLVLFMGTGLILYLILWMVIPEATTTAQKLEMHGEPITIDNIVKSIKNEFEDVRKKMNF